MQCDHETHEIHDISSTQLCVQKLRILIEDSDQNLKYLGLLAMGKILMTNPKSVQVKDYLNTDLRKLFFDY